MEKNYSYITSKDWYSQGGDMRMLYIVDPYSTAYNTYGSENALAYLVRQHHTGYFSLPFYRHSVGVITALQRKDKHYVERKKKKNMDIADKLFVKFDKWNKAIAKADEKILLRILSRVHKICVEFWSNSLMIERYDAMGEEVVRRELKKNKVKIPEKDLNIMMAPKTISFSATEEIELSKKPNLKEHANKWFWIQNTWGHVEVLDAEYFRKKPLHDIKEFMEYSKKIVDQKNEIINKYKLNTEMQNILYMFEIMSEWRDERKKFSNHSVHLLYFIAKRLSVLWNFDIELLLNSFPAELMEWMQKGIPINASQLLKERDEYAVFLHKNNKTWIVTGEEGKYIVELIEEQLMKTKKELTGQAGNLGKAKGKVKIVKGIKEFPKFNKGDILVAPNTRPEYVPIMKKAAAIVTDEGGITNHAAIVSRELGIPSIVGTQIATRVLKDNQIVEVDADNGIVRVLK